MAPKPMTPSEMGKKGGAKRMAALTAKQRTRLARKAAKARWAKREKENAA
jgi:hypothetical protein